MYNANKKVVTKRPITWCDDPDVAVSYFGGVTSQYINVTVTMKSETSSGVFVGVRFVNLSAFVNIFKISLLLV